MKAVVIREHGGPDKLRVEDVPEPEYTEDEVVIKVHSAGLNHLDIWVRKGRGGLNLPKPHILGSDVTGRMETGEQFGKIVVEVSI